MTDVQEALEKLATWFEAQDQNWRELSRKSDSEAGKEYWRGTANAYRDCAEQLRGLLYELKNPPPSGPWDNASHMDDELAGWHEDHPLMETDDEGHSQMAGRFYQ